VVAGSPELIDCWMTPSRNKIEYWPSYKLDGLLNCRIGPDTIAALKRCANVEYLLIDDIDRLLLDRISAVRLENIIERRQAKKLTTVVTSEDPPDSLKYRRGYNRIVRKLACMTRSVEIEGEPIEYELPFPIQ